MENKKRIGVLLCGCGHRDGSEIHESTLALLAIDLAGAEAICMAPGGDTLMVRDHLNGAEVHEKRSMLLESARIARGNIRFASQLGAKDLDALIIPGGQGTALNLSTFLIDGAKCRVNADMQRLVGEMTRAKKPIGAICIAPATLARTLQIEGISARITCGTDEQISNSIEDMGHEHEQCAAIDCVIDSERKIVTTPAYMNAKSIGEVWQGIEKLVHAVIEMTR
jgi:enhancing lycopene biosynthesis protein 2